MIRTTLSADNAQGWQPDHPNEGISAASIGCLAFIAGVINTAKPSLDEWFVADGIDPASAVEWTQRSAGQDALFQRALSHGTEMGTAIDTTLRLAGHRPPGETHLLWVCVPDSIDGTQRWCAAFFKDGPRFSPAEQDRLIATVRLWQARYNHPSERGLSLLLTGTQRRLLLADPACKLRLHGAGVTAEDLLNELFIICNQRWPEARPGDIHDVSLPFADGQLWATVRLNTPAFEGALPQTLVELRPLAEGELPTVGVINDERVARALGYLHDHYHHSPTLNKLAAQVDISPFHFHRVFAKHVGISPKQYQLLKQLQVSKWRLRSGGEPIGEIAERVGFANHAHFTATFRRVLGISPTEFRAAARLDNA